MELKQQLKMKTNTTLFLVLLFISLQSCSLINNWQIMKSPWRDTSIYLTKSFVSNHIEIQTKVDKFVPSQNWYYGSITLKNNSKDTLRFNFNQRLVCDGDTLRCSYNYLPISYATTAFQVVPNACKSWNVVWSTQKKYRKNVRLELVLDSMVTMWEINKKW
jgi:hypothetical protein